MHNLEKLEQIAGKPNPDFEQLHSVLTKGKKPLYTPLYELYVNSEVMEAVLGKKIHSRADTIEFYHRAGYDYVPVWPTVSFDIGSLIHTSSDYPIKNYDDLKKYSWPTKDTIQFDEFESVIPLLPKGMKIIGQCPGIFETLQSLMGYQNLCIALYEEEDLVSEIVENIGRVYTMMYEGMAGYREVGALVISDDMGYKTQTLISPDHLRKLILPRHKELSDIAHSRGKPCILHSCGNLEAIMEDIITFVGIDAKHSFEDQIMPVTRMYERYGDRIAILGGIDVDRLCRSTEEEITEYTGLLIDTCGPGGNYAIGSGNSITGYVPLENYFAMLKTAFSYR